jgi:AsmA protein
VGFYSLRLRGFESPFRTNGVQLTFEPATFTMYGGAHRGAMAVDLSRTPARWTLDSRMTKLDVGDFMAALTAREGQVDGTAAATAALHGAVGDTMPDGLAGRVEINIADGVIREFPLLATINRAMRLAEGDTRHTQFERLSATFALPGRGGGRAAGSGYATTDNLVLLARDVRVEASGRIGFDRSLNFGGLAVLSPERTASAIRSVHELSGLRNDRGELELPIKVTGTLDDPSFQIDLKAAVGRSLKEELRRRIKGLFRQEQEKG